MRTQHRRGQSLMEYSFIVILVIMGIVAMGPYVLRSINAHYKIWDEEIQDSHNENLGNLPAVITAGGDSGGGISCGSTPNGGTCAQSSDCASCSCETEFTFTCN